MDLRCPSCNSTNLKSLSVAFQEGRFSVNTQLAFARGGRRRRWARRCDRHERLRAATTERPFQEAQSSDKMVIRQADLVVGRILFCGAGCVRALGHVTSWACVIFSGDSVRRDFPHSLSSPLGCNLATQSFNVLSGICRVDPLVCLRTMRNREPARSRLALRLHNDL